MDFEALDKHLRVSLRLLAVVAVLAIAGYFTWFGLILEEPLSTDTGTWGVFGDFVGGLLNPLVAACALYWLTMSVRLQKHELAAARKELAMTRSELATASTAQKEQARLAMLATQINSLTIRLSAVSTELANTHERVNYVLERMDERGPSTAIYENSGGFSSPAISVLKMLENKSKRLEKMREAILSELSKLNIISSATQDDSIAHPHGQL